MEALKGNIFLILNGYKQFLIPVYQRYYSWNIEHCERLWEDIVIMQKAGKEGHFVGSIVNITENAMPMGVQKFMIIDGQQRMTTLTLLVLALRDYISETKKPEESNDETVINETVIENMLLKNQGAGKDSQYKLVLTETDRDTLFKLVDKIPVPEGTKSRLLENYNFFLKKIRENILSPKSIYEAVGKLQIVNITLDRKVDDAQAIFESLNSTGKELTESDLIRNYVLMGLEPGEQTYVYDHLWRQMELLFEYETQDYIMDRFFRDYLTMKVGRISKQSRVYEEFKKYHTDSPFKTIRELCEDLLKFAKYYTNIIFKRSSNPIIKSLYEDINDLRMEVSFPFLLRVHEDFSKQLISESEFCEILRLCISYVFRRNVCNIPTNSLNKTFATLKNSIRVDEYLNSIKAFFILRDDYKEFPKDDKFAAAFVSRDIYNMRTRNYILSHLENYNNKAPIRIDNYTIEHIMPQNSRLNVEWQTMLGVNWKEIQKIYLNTIGNLTLTAYNSEMSDHEFMKKMDMEGGFKQSALRLNSYVVLQTVWNEEKITERAKQLVEIAKNIWPYPNMKDSELLAYTDAEKSTEEYSISSYDVNDTTKALYDALDRRIMNLSSDVKREFTKTYVAYKLDTNFADVIFQKQRLLIYVNMNFSEIHDTNGICRNVEEIGHLGNGNVELSLNSVSDVDQVMDIIEQSYHNQADD